MVAPHHHRKSLGGGTTEALSTNEPLLDGDVTDELVTDRAASWARSSERVGVQPGTRHAVAKQRHLNGESRTRLANVVDCRKPPRKSPNTVSSVEETCSDPVNDLAREPLIHEQLRHTPCVVQVLVQRKPANHQVAVVTN